MRFNGGSIAHVLGLPACMMMAATASASDDSAFFLGANVGRAPIETNNALYQTQLEASASSSGSLAFTHAHLSKRDATGWLDGGYMIQPYVGVELAYFRFGQVYNQVSGTFTPTLGTPEAVYASSTLKSSGPSLGMLFRLPLTDSVAVNLRLADYYARTRLAENLITSAHFPTSTASNGSSLLAALGVGYVFGGHWSANADFLRINKAGTSRTTTYDINLLSVGANYAF